MREELAARLLGATEIEDHLAAMRRFKNEETLRIGLSDVSGVLDVHAVHAQLTELADVLIGASLRMAEEEVFARWGRPADPRVAVLGLGTLGGSEMGYQSDLDLVFLNAGGDHELHSRLAAKLLSNLSVPTREGVLYRIDTRLRPSGSKGSLVSSFEAFRRYHEGRLAQLWERQALCKARRVAGDRALWEQARAEVLEPAVWGKELPPGAAADIRAMRDRVERETAGEDQVDLKAGRGGVADIEFAVQHLLLAHGRERPELRTPRTREAVDRLAAAGLVDAGDANTLLAAHTFLRRVELRMRLMRERATSRLPAGRELVRLARSLGYTGAPAEALLADSEAWTERVRGIFDKLVPPGA